MNPFGKSPLAKTWPLLGMLPAVVLYVVFGILPSLSTAFISFTNISPISGTPWKFLGFENYKLFFHTATNPFSEQGILVVLKNTLIFTVTVTIVQNMIALLSALLINAKPKGHLFYRSVIFLPTILGVTISGLIWSLIFSPISGPAQQILHLFGKSSNFFGSNTAAFPLVIFVQIWLNMGFSMIIFLAGLQTIPVDLYEAADLDGGRRWEKFRHVTFPLIFPSVTVNVLLAIIGSLQTYDVIFVITKGKFHTTTLGMLIYNAGFGGGANLGYASSISMVMFVFVLVVTSISQFYLRRKETELL